MIKIIIFIATSFLLTGCSQNNLWNNINDRFDERIIPPPPGIVTMTPGNNDSNVHTDSVIEIIFDDNTDSGKLVDLNFELLDEGGNPIAYTFGLSNKTVTMEPCAPHLKHDSSYSIHIVNVLESEQMFNFTTMASPTITTEPVINTGTGNAFISFYCNFSQPMISDGFEIEEQELCSQKNVVKKQEIVV